MSLKLLVFPTLFLVAKPLLVIVYGFVYYRSNKLMHESILYRITDDGIHMSGQTFELELDWNNVSKIREIRNWLLVYQDEKLYTQIPKSAINPNDLKLIIEFGKP